MTDIDNGGCGCHAAEANPAQSASEQPAEADGCTCGCGGRKGAGSQAARAARAAGHSDISDGREDLGLRGAR